MVYQSALGFYGKLPSVGDFVSRRVARSFVTPWDQWLQSAITVSREQLTPNWLDIYLTSPIWRFALSSGVCGKQAWTGILMPSVDKVGRYFPLALVLELPEDSNPLRLIEPQVTNDWFEQVESVALSVLEEKALSLEAFDQRVLDIQTDAIVISAEEGKTLPADDSGDAWHLGIESVQTAAYGFPLLLYQLLKTRFETPTFWWTDGSQWVDPCLLVAKGLPPANGFSAMLGGRWDDNGWQDWSIAQYKDLAQSTPGP